MRRLADSGARNDLSRVNSATLGADGKTQFETVQRFLQQAEDALKSPGVGPSFWKAPPQPRLDT